jgi:hypothetical protein
MPPNGDMWELLDNAFGRLPGEMGWLPPELARALALPVLLVALVILFRIVVRRVVPWLAKYLLRPAVFAVTGAVAFVALTVDFVLTRAFRLIRLAPTLIHYAIGDVTLAGAASARVLTRVVVRQIGRLARFSPALLLVAAVVVVIWWSAGYCDRNPAAGCQAPLSAWVQDVGDLW